MYFENEVNIDQDDSDDDNVVYKRAQIAVDIIPPTDNLSVDHQVSTDNVSITNPSTDNQNSRSMELGGVSHTILASIQDEYQTCHNKGSGLKVTPLNSLLVMQMKVLRQEVQLRMSVCISAFYLRKNQRKLKMCFKIQIGF